MPPLLTTIALYAAILLIGMAAGIFLNEKRKRHPPEDTTNNVSLFLQFSDEHTIPKEIRQANIFSWYALYTESIYVDTLDQSNKSIGGFSVPPRWSVFILFKKPVVYRQMLAKCAGAKNPQCAVQFSNDRYAIITITGEVELATLDVSVVS